MCEDTVYTVSQEDWNCVNCVLVKFAFGTMQSRPWQEGLSQWTPLKAASTSRRTAISTVGLPCTTLTNRISQLE